MQCWKCNCTGGGCCFAYHTVTLKWFEIGYVSEVIGDIFQFKNSLTNWTAVILLLFELEYQSNAQNVGNVIIYLDVMLHHHALWFTPWEVMCKIEAPYWISFRSRVSFICIPNSREIMFAHAHCTSCDPNTIQNGDWRRTTNARRHEIRPILELHSEGEGEVSQEA